MNLRKILFLILIVAIAGSSFRIGQKTASNINVSDIVKVSAFLQPTAGNTASGIVTFTQIEAGMKVEATVTGLTPGKHGFHIHQFGDISKPDGTAAGGHFNPEGVIHGSPDDSEHHVGDLGNIIAEENGHAYYNKIFPKLTLSGKNSILGRGVIIHETEDDGVSQPTGAAGARVSQGVIGVFNSK